MKKIESPREFKVISLRECPIEKTLCDTPDKIGEYWRKHIETMSIFDPEKEFVAAILLDAKRNVKGHQLIGIGILDQCLVHAREVFRAAIVSAAHAVVLVHNHPSGSNLPSNSDVKVSGELLRAGRIIGIEFLDSIIIAGQENISLRGLGLLV